MNYILVIVLILLTSCIKPPVPSGADLLYKSNVTISWYSYGCWRVNLGNEPIGECFYNLEDARDSALETLEAVLDNYAPLVSAKR